MSEFESVDATVVPAWVGLSCPVAFVIPEVLGITVQIVGESEVDCGGLHL